MEHEMSDKIKSASWKHHMLISVLSIRSLSISTLYKTTWHQWIKTLVITFYHAEKNPNYINESGLQTATTCSLCQKAAQHIDMRKNSTVRLQKGNHTCKKTIYKTTRNLFNNPLSELPSYGRTLFSKYFLCLENTFW